MSLMKRLREPITIPRWVLTVKYAFFLVLAGATAVRGSATLDLTTPAGYTPIWCAAVAAGALVALPSSIVRAWEAAEKWAAVWIAGWLSVVAVGAALAEGSGWLYATLVALLPAGRAISLFSKPPR